MTGYVGPIEKQTTENTYFRHVLFTGPHSQLVVMCLRPGEDTGVEAIYDLLTAEPPGWDGAQDQGRGGSRRSSKTSVGRKVLSGRAACGLGLGFDDRPRTSRAG